MDTDWCLACSRHLDGNSGSGDVYCSAECYHSDNHSPSTPSSIFEQSDQAYLSACVPSTNRWTGNDHAGILAWAREVSPGFLPEKEIETNRDPSPKTPRPKLLDMLRCPLPPSVSVSSPRPAQPTPSKPILTPQSSGHAVLYRHSADELSMTTSFLTDSVVTPASSRVQSPKVAKSSIIGALATQMRSWVAPTGAKPLLPQKRSPRDPSVQGLDSTPFTVFARAHRAVVSPLAVQDEDLLPSKGEWDSLENEFLSGWFLDSAASKRQTHSTLLPQPASDDHPVFRSRGRKTARLYIS